MTTSTLDVSVVANTPERVSAHVHCDRGIHDVQWSTERRWSCSCPEPVSCAHIVAVALITGWRWRPSQLLRLLEEQCVP